MNAPLSTQYEQQARAEERAPVPILIKVARIVVWIVYAIVIVKVVMLSVAFLLRLLGASTDAAFVEWVYRSADRSMEPFRGIFPAREISDASVLDGSLLFAAVVYLIVALLLDAALRYLADKLTAHQRRIRMLRDAAQDAALTEYEAQQVLAAAELVAAAQARARGEQPPARVAAPSSAGVKASPTWSSPGTSAPTGPTSSPGAAPSATPER